MPKIIMPACVKDCGDEWLDCPLPDGVCPNYKPEGGLGALYRAVEDAGAIPDSKLKPKEGAPDYIAVILTCDSEHEDRGATHEEAMVNVIAKVNEEAEHE